MLQKMCELAQLNCSCARGRQRCTANKGARPCDVCHAPGTNINISHPQ